MYFTAADGESSCDLGSPWSGPLPLSSALRVPCIIIRHEILREELLGLPQITICPAVLLNMWSVMLGSLLGNGATLIDRSVSYSYSCRKLARQTTNALKRGLVVLLWGRRRVYVRLSVNDFYSFCSAHTFCFSFQSVPGVLRWWNRRWTIPAMSVQDKMMWSDERHLFTFSRLFFFSCFFFCLVVV